MLNRRFSAVLFVSLAGAFASWGQSDAGAAALQVRVSDPSGKAIEAAAVSIREMNTGFVRKAATNVEGELRLGGLPVGSYRIDSIAPGFGTSTVEGLALTVGETKTLNVTLQVASISTQVNVEAEADIVDQSDTSNGVVISERAVRDLPIRGRNFTQFVQLSPNTMQEQNRFGVVINGQRSINSNISLDGVDYNDPLQGGQRGGGANESEFFFPQIAVREFQVVRDGASAEVGRTNSGYVNVVTKSGTNDYHGEGFYNNRNGSLTSPDAFGNDSSANAQNQFGGAFGGPIQKEKLFFFGAAEKNFVTIPYTVKFNTPTGNTPIPADIAAQQGTFSGRNNPLVAFGRMDYQLSPRNSLNLQYTYAAQQGLTFNGPTGQTNVAATNNTFLDRASQGVKAAWTLAATPTLVNEVRGQWVYDNRLQAPYSTLPEIDFSDNWATLGGAKGGTNIYNATRYQILDTLSWIHGIHSLRFGVDVNISPEQQQRETNYSGVYTFANLADYIAALAGDKSKILSYNQSIAANGTQGLYEGTQKDYAAFVSDVIRLRKDFTLTVGLRWDGQVNPQPSSPNPKYSFTGQIPNDLKMWQPRLGFAWNVGGKGTTVIRVSAGIFDSRTPGYLMQRVFTDNGLNTLVLDSKTDPTIVNYLTVPNRIDQLPNGVKTPIVNAIYAFDPAFRNPRSGQAAFAIEQQINKDTKLTVGFVRNSTWALQRRFDRNLFEPNILPNGMPVYPTFDTRGNLVYASGWDPVNGPVFVDSTGKTVKAAVARPDPTIGQENFNVSVGHSSYNGASFSLERRMSRRLMFTLNYTHAFNRDDDTNERDFNRQTALDTYNLKLDSGWSKNDIRNSGNINALYDLGHGFTIGTLFLAHTGYPVKAVLGADLQNDGNTVNDVPIVNGHIVNRNTLRQPGFLDWDMRLLKQFKLGERARVDLSIEGFNITRSTNKQFNADGESSFGKPQAAVNPLTGYAYQSSTAGIPIQSPGTDFFGGARQAQLGIRFQF
jgi:carboxypeptidase family protein